MWKRTATVRNDRQVPKRVHRSDRDLEEQLLIRLRELSLEGVVLRLSWKMKSQFIGKRSSSYLS